MNEPNNWLMKMIALADANGWIVVAYDANADHAYVKLHDARGTTVTLEGNYGLDFHAYLTEIKAIARASRVTP